MSFARWAVTMSVLGTVAWALQRLGPGWSDLQAAVADPQGLVDRAGADALVLVGVPVLAWLCWAWGTLGLLLTAATTVPGGIGRLAGRLLTGVLPAGARRAATLALGLTLSTAAPVLLPVSGPGGGVLPAAAAGEGWEHPPQVPVDWPTAPATDVVPDWPSAPAPVVPPTPASALPDQPQSGPGDHVVHRGDCLWDIAADWLQRGAPHSPVTDAAVRHAVSAWWQANAAVIGPDPDLLLPGQVLRPPV